MKLLKTIFQVTLTFVTIFLISRCNFNKEIDINGIWVDGSDILEITGDTIIIHPLKKEYIYNIQGNEIILTKNIETESDDKLDTLKLPQSFGSIYFSDSKYYISSLLLHKFELNFEKLNYLNSNSKLLKFQFSSGYWSSGFNFEIDSFGNSHISEDGFCDNHKTYSFKVSKKDRAAIYTLASNVQFDKIKPSYVGGCADASRYSFSFFFDHDTINTFIYCEWEHSSLAALRTFLEGKTRVYCKDTIHFTEEEDRFFFSRLAECQNDTASIISYHRKFDTLNYKLPIYDMQTLKGLFDKYYKFKDENICFHIHSDSLGKIRYFEFFHSEIPTNQKFLKEIKESVFVKPAIFKGKKIGLKDFECINYYKNE